MRVAVLGAGVVGVASAYYLARAGHEVTVIDRRPAAALETSFANAGEISPGYASPTKPRSCSARRTPPLSSRHGSRAATRISTTSPQHA